jgi:uncharacterized protein YjgD (DUF1641 family)
MFAGSELEEETMEHRTEIATKKDIKEVEKALTEKIDTNSKQLENVTIQVVKNSEEIKKMVTKQEFSEFRQEILTGQEKMMTILTRLDQERVFTIEWIKRIEKAVEKNKNEIERIKLKLSTF